MCRTSGGTQHNSSESTIFPTQLWNLRKTDDLWPRIKGGLLQHIIQRAAATQSDVYSESSAAALSTEVPVQHDWFHPKYFSVRSVNRSSVEMNFTLKRQNSLEYSCDTMSDATRRFFIFGFYQNSVRKFKKSAVRIGSNLLVRFKAWKTACHWVCFRRGGSSRGLDYRSVLTHLQNIPQPFSSSPLSLNWGKLSAHSPTLSSLFRGLLASSSALKCVEPVFGKRLNYVKQIKGLQTDFSPQAELDRFTVPQRFFLCTINTLNTKGRKSRWINGGR